MDGIIRSLVQGQLKSGQLPQTIDIWDLEEGLAELRRCSFRQQVDQQVEWGGCIVLEKDRLQLMHRVGGRRDGVDPNCTPEDHDYYVGFAHIHLPDDDTGLPYLGFSERDFGATLADGDNLALVCNGPEVFALVRTADYTQPRRTPSQSEFQEWEHLYDNLIQQAKREMTADPAARQRGSDALNKALWQANRKMCQELGFAFYRGLWGQPLILIFRP